jgi:adenylate cyclase
MGDAIMAFFGAPIKSSTHANEACRCALQSLVKLKEIQDSFMAQNLPLIDIGIGINTGEMSVGNMGSHIVQNYTIMGDAVNLASRLEGINKEYGTRIIISEFTNEEIKDEFTAREVDRVRVKGKLKPVKIYELICEGKPDEILQSRLNTYNQGLSLYQNKNFKEALQKFEESKVSYQNDPVVELYIKRCQEYLQVPPPEGWDGVYLMKTK